MKNYLMKSVMHKTRVAEPQPNSDKEVIVLAVFEVKAEGKGFETIE